MVKRTVCLIVMLIPLALAAVWPNPAGATFIEQLAIDTRAISMANAVTARPPGHMSIHYNPAGLSQFEEGAWWHQGVTIPWLVKTSKFRGNEDFDGWLSMDRWDHHADPIYEGHPAYGEEGRELYTADDLYVEGTAQSGRMYIPIYDEAINFQISPRTSLAYRGEDSRLTLATGMYTPFATGANHADSDDPTRFGGRRAYMQHLIYQAPSASYELTDRLAVGLSMGFGQSAMGAEMFARSPNDLVALTRELGEATEGMAIPPWTYLYYDEPLYGGGIHPWEPVAKINVKARNDFTPSYNLGILYEPFDWLGFGMVYQSEIEADMHGSFSVEYSEDFRDVVRWYGQGPWGTRRTAAMLDMPTQPTQKQSGTFTTDLVFPRRVQFGVRLSPLSRLHLMFDLKWSEWSARERDEYHFDQDIQMLQIAKLTGHVDGNRTLASDRYMRDTLDWAAAVEINLTDRLDFQFGYEFRESSVRDEYFDFATPIPDMHNVGAGISYHLENGGRIDVGGAYIWHKGYEIGPEESKNLTSTDYFNDNINMFAGQHFEQDLEIYMFSIGFVVPFESYVDYQKGNVEKMRQRLRFLNPFTRSGE